MGDSLGSLIKLDRLIHAETSEDSFGWTSLLNLLATRTEDGRVSSALAGRTRFAKGASGRDLATQSSGMSNEHAAVVDFSFSKQLELRVERTLEHTVRRLLEHH